jgi:hypothetical protein
MKKARKTPSRVIGGNSIKTGGTTVGGPDFFSNALQRALHEGFSNHKNSFPKTTAGRAVRKTFPKELPLKNIKTRCPMCPLPLQAKLTSLLPNGKPTLSQLLCMGHFQLFRLAAGQHAYDRE